MSFYEKCFICIRELFVIFGQALLGCVLWLTIFIWLPVTAVIDLCQEAIDYEKTKQEIK